MQHSTLLKTSLLAIFALGLGACQNMVQPAATVQDGTNSGNFGTGNVVTTTLPDNNPYGTAPLNNPYDSTSTAPVTNTVPSAFVGNYAPVDKNAAYHVVGSGDTVYNITKRYGISQEQLREWNNMTDNNVRLGTRLRVKPADYTGTGTYTSPTTTTVVTTPVVNKPVVTQTVITTPVVTPPTTTTTVVSTPTVTQTTTTTTSSTTRTVNNIVWMRPTAGNIITQFNSTNKGVDIAGNAGQAVVAAADGKVVYSGSDLRGYGNLVIVQHSPVYLTAYGHNQKLLVKENDTVTRGQVIANMGNTHTDRYKLHFEVRQNGKPVNPLDYIPN